MYNKPSLGVYNLKIFLGLMRLGAVGIPFRKFGVYFI